AWQPTSTPKEIKRSGVAPALKLANILHKTNSMVGTQPSLATSSSKTHGKVPHTNSSTDSLELEVIDGEGSSYEYTMVLVQIPMSNEREVYE
ncbi:unnamed protein product, partial [Ilex paraguariensis]